MRYMGIGPMWYCLDACDHLVEKKPCKWFNVDEMLFSKGSDATMGMFFSITTKFYFNMFVKSHAVVHVAIHLATHDHAIEAYLDLRLPYIKKLIILVCHGLITICMYIQVPFQNRGRQYSNDILKKEEENVEWMKILNFFIKNEQSDQTIHPK